MENSKIQTYCVVETCYGEQVEVEVLGKFAETPAALGKWLYKMGYTSEIRYVNGLKRNIYWIIRKGLLYVAQIQKINVPRFGDNLDDTSYESDLDCYGRGDENATLTDDQKKILFDGYDCIDFGNWKY